jgi:DNA-binding transcriptional LysR family regulator
LFRRAIGDPRRTFVPLTDVEDARTALCWRADENHPAIRAFVATIRSPTAATP